MADASQADLVQSALRKARDADCRIVDVRFTDLPGTWQHFSIPLDKLDEDVFAEGLGFDGSSVRGFQQIHESDMLVMPDPTTAFVDPTLEVPTLVLTGSIQDPVTGESYSRDPRHVAQKAEQHLIDSGIADVSYWGPEAEFFILNSVRFDQTAHAAFYFIDSEEGIWNSGADDAHGPNLGHRPLHKRGYFPVPPTDKLQDLRSRMTLALMDVGIDVELHHHEVATGGQAEIDIRYGPLTKIGDQMMLFKYIVKNVARQHGYTVTFMPKPIFGDNGSGMHVHQSLWKNGSNLFYDADGYALLSETARHYIGGLLRHAPALLAFCAPTTNSYRATGARIRGAGQPGVLPAQSERVRAHSGIFAEPGGTARRVPPAGPKREPVPGLCRHVDGPAWTGFATRSSPRTRWTSTYTTWSPRRPRRCSRCLGRSTRCWTRWKPTTRFCGKAACSRRT